MVKVDRKILGARVGYDPSETPWIVGWEIVDGFSYDSIGVYLAINRSPRNTSGTLGLGWMLKWRVHMSHSTGVSRIVVG